MVNCVLLLANERYVVSPSWRADAYTGPLDTSRPSWAATGLPQQHETVETASGSLARMAEKSASEGPE